MTLHPFTDITPLTKMTSKQYHLSLKLVKWTFTESEWSGHLGDHCLAGCPTTCLSLSAFCSNAANTQTNVTIRLSMGTIGATLYTYWSEFSIHTLEYITGAPFCQTLITWWHFYDGISNWIPIWTLSSDDSYTSDLNAINTYPEFMACFFQR